MVFKTQTLVELMNSFFSMAASSNKLVTIPLFCFFNHFIHKIFTMIFSSVLSI